MNASQWDSIAIIVIAAVFFIQLMRFAFRREPSRGTASKSSPYTSRDRQ